MPKPHYLSVKFARTSSRTWLYDRPTVLIQAGIIARLRNRLIARVHKLREVSVLRRGESNLCLSSSESTGLLPHQRRSTRHRRTVAPFFLGERPPSSRKNGAAVLRWRVLLAAHIGKHAAAAADSHALDGTTPCLLLPCLVICVTGFSQDVGATSDRHRGAEHTLGAKQSQNCTGESAQLESRSAWPGVSSSMTWTVCRGSRAATSGRTRAHAPATWGGG